MPIKTGPDYSKLKSSLVNSQTQVTNNALFQTIDQLITGVKKFQSIVSDTLDKEFAAIQAKLVELENSITELEVFFHSYDEGHADCDETDVLGTEILFNKSFSAIDSIVAVVISDEPRTVVIDFDFTSVNPLSFFAFVYDNSGTRTSDTIAWNSYGIPLES